MHPLLLSATAASAHVTFTHKLLWLEAMRGAAAIWVLLHHAVLLSDKYLGGLGPAWQVLVNGSLGVDFFFVLSGFIIAMSCERLAANGHGLRDYLRARVLRIYVPYLPIGVAMLALYLLLPSVSEGRDTPGILTSLTLMPSNQPPALSVAWTLVHEMIFYLLFSVFFASRVLLAGVIAVWVACIVSAWLLDLSLGPASSTVLSPINLCFVLGTAAFYAARVGIGQRSAIQVLLVGLMLVGSQAAAQEPLRVLVALGFVLIALAATTPALQASPPARSLVWLGAASYSIYLVHNPALSVEVRLVLPWGADLATPLLLIGVAGLALIGGLLYFRFYEQPVLNYFKRRIMWARQRPLESDG